MQEEKTWQGENRRHTPRNQDKFYRIIMGLNLVAWLVFLIAMIVFHYARPELISGVQEFWGLEGRTDWSSTLTFYLLMLLGLCFTLGVAVVVMKRRRSRRKNDFFGINIGILLTITVTSLIWIMTQNGVSRCHPDHSVHDR